MNREYLNKLYERWFCPEGRMKRSLFMYNFFGTLGAMIILQGIGIAVLLLFMTFLGLDAGDVYDASDYMDGVHGVWYVVFILLGIICMLPSILGFYALFRASMRRWHDIGHGDKRFLAFFIYIPILLFMVLGILFLVMMITAGISAVAFQVYDVDPNFMIVFLILCILSGGIGLYHAALLLYLCIRKSEMQDNAYGTLESRAAMLPEIRTRPAESISLMRALFRVRGRLNRKRFFFGLLLAGLLVLPVQLLLVGFRVDETSWGTAVTMLLSALLPAGFYMQRLQDIGRSPLWWAVPTIITCAVCVLFAGMDILMPFVIGMEEGMFMDPIVILGGAYIVLYYLYDTFLGTYLYFAPGDAGENAYGADPLVRAADEGTHEGCTL